MPVLAAVLVLKTTIIERTLALRVEPPCDWLAMGPFKADYC